MEALLDRFIGINPRVSKEMRFAINRGAREVRNTAMKSINQMSRGRVYGKHRASRAGDAPNKDTGNLIRNIRVSTGRGNALKGYYATVEAVTPYAVALEKGTKNMKPRPFMKPALKKNQKLINDLVRKAIRSAIK